MQQGKMIVQNTSTIKTGFRGLNRIRGRKASLHVCGRRVGQAHRPTGLEFRIYKGSEPVELKELFWVATRPSEVDIHNRMS